jgi:hypothetical protein
MEGAVERGRRRIREGQKESEEGIFKNRGMEWRWRDQGRGGRRRRKISLCLYRSLGLLKMFKVELFSKYK